MKKALILTVLLAAMPALGFSQTDSTLVSFPRIGHWKVTGKDSENWMGALVIEEVNGQEFSGFFEWHYRALVMNLLGMNILAEDIIHNLIQ